MHSYQPSTIQNYRRSWSKFTNFLLLNGEQLNFPYSDLTVASFIVFLNKQGLKTTTIRSHLSAISAVHKLHSAHDPTASYLVRRTLRGSQKSQAFSSSKLLPINKPLLVRMVNTLQFSLPQYDALLFQSLFLLSYHCCLRASEAVHCKTSSHTLRLSDISFQIPPQPLLAKITFPSCKYNYDKIELVLHHTKDLSCPVTALLKYLVVRGDHEGPLFIKMNLKPINRSHYSKVIKDSIKYLGIDPTRYNTHSFRIGRATDLAILGASSRTIKLAGRWQSNAYEKYIRIGQISFPDA